MSKGDIKDITWREIVDYNGDIAWLCNNHIYNAMISKGVAKKEDYLPWFNKNFLVQRSYFPPVCPFKTAAEIIDLINKSGGIAVLAHPHEQLDDVDGLISLGLKEIETSHSMLNGEEKEKAYKLAMEKNLFISGGTDHEGLCGGCYSSYPNEAELKKLSYYLETLSVGVREEHFCEIQNGRLCR